MITATKIKQCHCKIIKPYNFSKMAGKMLEIIVLDSSSDDEFSTPVPRVKNIHEMKKLENADEDCFILEFDPDDADLDLSKLSISDKNADADLLIVAQKGQVACRDFPHPRHACAIFPFRTTSQDSHCKHCYCYVCDLPAPCKMWVGNYNHCLAFDDERWNTIRKLTREANKLQKQVACRDFPHPRHACAIFPFRTTPRDSYCKFCYCYVCDLPAPCKMWDGSFNHCSAFDNGTWNAKRKLARQAKKLQEQGFINHSTVSDGDVKKGNVKWFNDWKGFGFIIPDDGTGDLFFHRSSIKSDGICSLGDGEAVEYKVKVGNDGRSQAIDITSPNGESVQGSTRGSGGGRHPWHGGGVYGGGGGGSV